MFPGPICLYPKPVALLSTLIVLSKLRARMVNYKDPATMAQDYGACAIPSGTYGSIYQLTSSTEALVKMWHLIDGVFM